MRSHADRLPTCVPNINTDRFRCRRQGLPRKDRVGGPEVGVIGKAVPRPIPAFRGTPGAALDAARWSCSPPGHVVAELEGHGFRHSQLATETDRLSAR